MPRSLIGGRGATAHGSAAVDAAIEQTRGFLQGMIDKVGEVHKRGGTLKEAFEATHEHLAPKFGMWPIFEHCLPFRRAAPVGRDGRHRLAPHLDRRTGPGSLGQVAGLIQARSAGSQQSIAKGDIHDRPAAAAI